MLDSLGRLQADLRRVGKPRAVEGVLDHYLIRPSGYVIARWMTPSWISPNVLSIIALAFGWVTAYYLYATARVGNLVIYSVLAAAAMMLHSAFDSADGQLARARGSTTAFGRMMDGICDYLSFAGMYLGIGIGLGLGPGGSLASMLILAAIGGLFHALQCAVVEYQRNLYKYYVHDTDLPFNPETSRDSDSESRRGGFLEAAHQGYSKLQEIFGGSSLKLWRELESARRKDPSRWQELVELIVASNRGRLKVWAFLAPNSHKVGMLIGGFVPLIGAESPLESGLFWYLIFVIGPMNLLLVGLIWVQSRSDHRTRAAVESRFRSVE